MKIDKCKNFRSCHTTAWGAPRHGRRGSSAAFLTVGLLVTTVVGGGIYFFVSRNKEAIGNKPILVPVTRSDFIAQVLDQGEVQSSENIEIRCEVRPAGGSVAVIEVIPEGTMIVNTAENPRDKELVLVRLDSKTFEKELEQQKLSVNTARTTVNQAEAAVKVAEQAKREYIEGIYVEDRKTIQNEIYNAQQEVEQAEAYLDHSTMLQKKGFITAQQLRGDRIAVQRAKNSYELALKKLEVLENVTKEKELIKLQSDIDAAQVKFENEQEALRIELNQLEDLETQLKNCVIYPPKNVSGQVVYHKESGRGGGTDWILAEGATVRERQVLMRIPNPEKMEVKALINEQSITSVREGMPVAIKVDALHGVQLKGKVTSVSHYAENEGWMSGSIKKFPVLVKIIDPPQELKPGMNGSVTIQTTFESNVLQLPVQCIYAAADKRFCLVQRGDRYETVELEVGGDNSKDVFIRSGVNEGDLVVMNPGNFREWLELPEQLTQGPIAVPNSDQPQADSANPPGGFQSAGDQLGGQSAPGGDRPPREGGQRGGGGGPEAMVDRMFERYDANADGTIDADEIQQIPEDRRGFIQRGDTDGDGKITREEIMAGMQQMMQQMQGGGGGGGPPQ